jgi:hypothetical protein
MRILAIFILLATCLRPQAVDYVRQVKNVPVTDIRTFGAKCDGTDQNTHVQAALSAGNTVLYIPAGCTWVAPSGLIPANLTIYGQNPLTSVIKSASNPATLGLSVGSLTVLSNLNLQGATVNSPTNCPINMAINSSTSTQPFISTCYSSFDSMSGQDNVDRTAAFFKVGAFPTGGTGDAANFSNCVGSVGCAHTGNSLRADNYSGVPGYAAIFGTSMPGAATGTAVITISNMTGPTSPTSPHAISVFDQYGTVGSLYQVNHRGTTYTGDAFRIEMADISGSFVAPGTFVNMFNGGTEKSSITALGRFTPVPVTTTLSNGANENISITTGTAIVAGPTSSFSIGGIVAGTLGDLVTIYNGLGQTMTIKYQDGSSTAANRIFIPTGADYVCPHIYCIVQLMYLNNQWVLLGSN